MIQGHVLTQELCRSLHRVSHATGSTLVINCLSGQSAVDSVARCFLFLDFQMFGLRLVLFVVFCGVCMATNNVNMERHLEQQATLKFLVASGHTPIQCFRQMREVYGDQSLGITQVRHWHQSLPSGMLLKKPGCPQSQQPNAPNDHHRR